MLDVNRLRVIDAVARNGSVTAAAKELHYSQPSVTHHLTRLEAETGAQLVQLVVRARRAGQRVRFRPQAVRFRRGDRLSVIAHYKISYDTSKQKRCPPYAGQSCQRAVLQALSGQRNGQQAPPSPDWARMAERSAQLRALVPLSSSVDISAVAPLADEGWLAWLGGFVTGEGWFSLQARRARFAVHAAGLLDRCARREPRVTSAPPPARVEERRRAVVAAVRALVDDSGRAPTVAQYLAYRLERAQTLPSLATAYRLFPGGWATVLRAAEVTDGRRQHPRRVELDAPASGWKALDA